MSAGVHLRVPIRQHIYRLACEESKERHINDVESSMMWHPVAITCVDCLKSTDYKNTIIHLELALDGSNGDFYEHINQIFYEL